MAPTAHWKRDMTPDFKGVIDGLTAPTTVAAVFDDRVRAEDFVKVVRPPSWAFASIFQPRSTAPSSAAMRPASRATVVGYSLGFRGQDRKLQYPGSVLSTMCVMDVSSSLAKKMIDWVKEGRARPNRPSPTWRGFAPASSIIQQEPSAS